MPQSSEIADRRPRIADVPFGLMLAAAVAVLVFAAMLPLQLASTVDTERRAAAAKQLSSASFEDTLRSLVIAAVVVAVLYAAALVWTAFRFRAGRRRARIVMIVLTVLALAPFNVQGVLVAVVLVVADVLAFRRPVSEWLRSAEVTRARARL
jgi:hypothetical protein